MAHKEAQSAIEDLSFDEIDMVDGGIIPALIIACVLLCWATAAY